MAVEVSSEVLEALLAQAAQAHPRECCGVLLGQGKRVDQPIPADNVHPAPESHFEIDPQVLIDCHRHAREGGPEVVGYYHSHPNGLARPSATDRDSASGDGRIWAIVANGAVTFWKDAPEGFEPLSLATPDS